MTTAVMTPDIAIQDILKNRNFYRVERATDSLPDNSIASASLESLRDTAKHEVHLYEKLNKGWDGYDGEVFDPTLIEKVITSLDWIHQILKNQGIQIDAIIPGPASDGTVDLEFRSGLKRMRLLFDADEDKISLYKNAGSTPEEYSIQFSAEDLEREFNWFSR